MNGEPESPASLGVRHLQQLVVPLVIVLAGIVVFRLGQRPEPGEIAPGLLESRAGVVTVEVVRPDADPTARDAAWSPGDDGP